MAGSKAAKAAGGRRRGRRAAPSPSSSSEGPALEVDEGEPGAGAPLRDLWGGAGGAAVYGASSSSGGEEEEEEEEGGPSPSSSSSSSSEEDSRPPVLGNGRGSPPRLYHSSDDDSEELEFEAVAGGSSSGAYSSSSDDGEAGPPGLRRLVENPELPGQLIYSDDSDSSEDEVAPRNTIGRVPLEWYDEEKHIGFDLDGERLVRKGRRDQLEALLDRNDHAAREWRTVYDEYNDEEVVLTKEEVKMIHRIRKGNFPSVAIDPHEDLVPWTSDKPLKQPLIDLPEPKARFVPSKWEAKRVVKLVRAIRRGWIKQQKAEAAGPDVYNIWEAAEDRDKTAAGLTYIPAPKPKLPGHEESYNPPAEYLLTEEELDAAKLAGAPPKFVPRAFDALRKVPLYEDFVKEQFERCLDLYLCPRTRRKRRHIVDLKSLVPNLPKPSELEPFPRLRCLEYPGHERKVTALAVHASGQWLASAAADRSVRVWEVATARCLDAWTAEDPIADLAWCPRPDCHVVAVAAGTALALVPVRCGPAGALERARAALGKLGAAEAGGASSLEWDFRADGTVRIDHKRAVAHVAWHRKGNYFATVCPTGNTVAVLVHQLLKQVTQTPFKKNKGRVNCVQFHPAKPLFFVAADNSIRVYDLAKQQLAKKLVSGAGRILSIDVHPGGDNVIAGTDDSRVLWFDLDLSTKPYKSIRKHGAAVRAVAFHRKYPLFASASDDGVVHVLHGMVFSDLMTNPLLVPLKALREHEVTGHEGVTDCVFHPTQPWIFSCGADGKIYLFMNR